MPLPKPLASSELAVPMGMKSKSSTTQRSGIEPPCGQKINNLAWKAVPVRRCVCPVLREQPGVQQTQKPTTHQHPSLTPQDSSPLSSQLPPNSADSQFGGNDFLPPNSSNLVLAISTQNYWSPLIDDESITDEGHEPITNDELVTVYQQRTIEPLGEYRSDTGDTFRKAFAAKAVEIRHIVAIANHREHAITSPFSPRASGRCPDPRSMPSSKQRDLSSARPRDSGAHLPPNPRISTSILPPQSLQKRGKAAKMLTVKHAAYLLRRTIQRLQITSVIIERLLEGEGEAIEDGIGGFCGDVDTSTDDMSGDSTTDSDEEFSFDLGLFISGGVLDAYYENNLLPLPSYWIAFGRPPPAPNWMSSTVCSLGFVGRPPPAPNWKQTRYFGQPPPAPNWQIAISFASMPSCMTRKACRQADACLSYKHRGNVLVIWLYHIIWWCSKGYQLDLRKRIWTSFFGYLDFSRGNVLDDWFGHFIQCSRMPLEPYNNMDGFYFFCTRGVAIHHGLRPDEHNLLWYCMWDCPSFILRTTFEHLIVCFDLRSTWPLVGYYSLVHWQFVYLVTRWNMFVLGALRQSNVFLSDILLCSLSKSGGVTGYYYICMVLYVVCLVG